LVFLKIQNGGSGHLENHKNRVISTTVLPIITKSGTVMGLSAAGRPLKNSNFQKIKMADGRHFVNC